MGTNTGIITKPQLPPKPLLRGGKWQRATDIVRRQDTEEAGRQIRARHLSMPMTMNSRQGISFTVNAKSLNSPPLTRPIPKPRKHKPTPLPDTLSQPADDNNLKVSRQASLSSSDSITSTDINYEADCPESSPHGSTHDPHHEDNNLYASTHLDKEACNSDLVNNNSGCHEKPRRIPPNIPVPSRPLPKEPQHIIITDVEETTDNDCKEGVYVDFDSEDCNLSPSFLENMTASSTTAPKLSPTRPVPALRKNKTHNKEEMTAQDKRLLLDNLRNELCWIFSGDKQESDGDIKKPRAITDVLVKFIMSKSKPNEQGKTPLSPTHNKTNSKKDKTQVNIAEEAARKARQKESPVQPKTPPVMEHMTSHLSDTTSAKSIQTPEQDHEISTTLPSSALEVQDTDISSKTEFKCDGKDSQTVLLESLWQERFNVKDSGILTGLTKEEIQLQESIYEVATSEQSYLDGLTVAVEHFQESPALKSAIAPRDQKSLFSDIHKIREISQKFMESMVQKLESSLCCDDICDVVHHYATGPFGAYVDYIRNMPYQKQTLLNLRKESPQFVEILSKLQDEPSCNRLPIDSFLSLPFQRIARLKILMETVLKRTAPGSDVQVIADKALREISKVVEMCNTEVGKMKQMEELVLIANKTEYECKALPLVSSSRCLVKEGDLVQLSLKENIFGQKKLCPVHLFLFNDLLLVATRKGSDRYTVHDHVHRSLVEVTEGVEVEEDLDGCDLNRVLQLAFVKNHRGAVSHYLLQASTQAERDSWLDVLSGRREEQEGVYEEWDCPQVRCTEVYYAQQPGELSLQQEDIINIIQKTSDGFMEGRRLHDGERGWFPAVCVEEISTEHVQRRHLRERYRVLQMAARVIKRCGPPKDCRTTACFK